MVDVGGYEARRGIGRSIINRINIKNKLKITKNKTYKLMQYVFYLILNLVLVSTSPHI